MRPNERPTSSATPGVVASFDRLMQAVEMVRHDSPAIFRAIERDNPFAAEVRERFFALAGEARGAAGEE